MAGSQSHSDEQAFEISVGEIEVNGRYTRQSVFVDAGKPYEMEIQVCAYDYGEDGSYYYVEGLDQEYTVHSIPALIAALRRAREIAEAWAAESEGS